MTAPPRVHNVPTVRAHPLGGIVVELSGLRLVSELNAHEHYRVRAKRAQEHHAVVGGTLRALAGDPVRLPCRVVITRIAPRSLDVGDNAHSSAKHARDAVARWLGVDDRDPRVEWMVAQEKGPYAVRVEVVPVRPFGGAGTARVTHEGAVTVVEAVLSTNNFDQLAAQVAAIGRGAQRSVTVNLGATRLVVRVPAKE